MTELPDINESSESETEVTLVEGSYVIDNSTLNIADL
jgi:hypothetical protein